MNAIPNLILATPVMLGLLVVWCALQVERAAYRATIWAMEQLLRRLE